MPHCLEGAEARIGLVSSLPTAAMPEIVTGAGLPHHDAHAVPSAITDFGLWPIGGPDPQDLLRWSKIVEKSGIALGRNFPPAISAHYAPVGIDCGPVDSSRFKHFAAAVLFIAFGS